jgi:hypothetical protein
MWKQVATRGNLNPPCQMVMYHLLKIVSVVLIEYQRNVIDVASSRRLITAFVCSLQRIYSPYLRRRKYNTKKTNDIKRDTAKYNQRKVNASILGKTAEGLGDNN